MDADLTQRMERVMLRLHGRALALSHPGQDDDLALALQAMALTLEAQRELARDVARITDWLDHQ